MPDCSLLTVRHVPHDTDTVTYRIVDVASGEAKEITLCPSCEAKVPFGLALRHGVRGAAEAGQEPRRRASFWRHYTRPEAPG